MTTASATSSAARNNGTQPSNISRKAMRAVASRAVSGLRFALFTAALPLVSAAQATPASAHKWEFRASSGALIGTGDQRNVLKDAQTSAAQLSWLIRPSLAVTGTVGWARSRDVGTLNSPKLDVFTSDLGVEVRPLVLALPRAVTFSPFAGAGAGVRSYNYRKLEVDATHNAAGYIAAGGEFGIRRVGLRLEARDYATGFKPLSGVGSTSTRNDVVLLAAIRFNRRGSAQ